MTTGKQLKSILSDINGDNIPDTLWELLPEHVAGAQWRGEIWNASRTLADWLNGDQDYDLDTLQDLSYELADSEVEDYYVNINRRVQELSLWAIGDLDEEVAETGAERGFLSFTDMNSLYLYCAMRGLYQTLSQWAIDSAEDMEEVA
jgi:hypothetical protein